MGGMFALATTLILFCVVAITEWNKLMYKTIQYEGEMQNE